MQNLSCRKAFKPVIVHRLVAFLLIVLMMVNPFSFAIPVSAESLTTLSADAPQFGISLDREEFFLSGIGESIQLRPTLHLLNDNAQQITWTSSDDSIATVSQDGVATPVYPGTAIITATSIFG